MAEVGDAIARHLGVERPAPPAVEPADLDPPAALDVLCTGFGLSAFERAVVLMCAGCELDASFAALCDGGPSFALALAALPDPHWSALAPHAPLRRWHLIEVTGHGLLTTSVLRIDEFVLHYLAGVNGTDPKLTGLFLEPEICAEPTPSQVVAAHQLTDLLSSTARPLPVLTGADAATRLAVASHACSDLGSRLSVVDARALPTDPAARDELARLLERDSLLGNGLYLVEATEAGAASLDLLTELSRAPVVLSADDGVTTTHRAATVVTVPRATASEQREVWRTWLGPDGAAESLAATFDLDPTRIRAASLAAGKDPDAIWAACRAVDRPALSSHAQRVQSSATWDDLVVPAAQLRALRLLTAHARHRVKVYDDWDMRMGRTTGLGSTAVFTGPSGTGKSYAAEVIANALELDLYRVDLSAVVSKYIGETEKNLRHVFDAADHGSTVLLFDEADALFGKRSEVRDSHDRYANVEVSYLLQRMEAYRGLAVLTTNLAEAIDSAFLRRVRFLVAFPFPDRAMRAELWRRAFAARTPTRDLDLDALATLDLAGGTIRNIAVNAAFLAADEGEPVGMAHVMQAARIESGKLGQPMPALRWEATS
jgi:hypothetical protein